MRKIKLNHSLQTLFVLLEYNTEALFEYSDELTFQLRY